jgi:RHS repeat-associated protein
MSWYGADKKLRFVQRVDYSNYAGSGIPVLPTSLNADNFAPKSIDGEFTEYRYDALGRRVYTSVNRSDPNICSANACVGFTEYTVWDGDQVIYERRASGSPVTTTTIRYTHGLGIDQPFSLIRNDTSLVIPHLDARGQYFAATNATGARNTGPYYPGGGPSHLNPAQPIHDLRQRPWYGSLLTGSTDENGLLYRRNRYYNPESGQFTQPDPIGIAGGLNVYGYAEGDPVNYSDPFGLSKCPRGASVSECVGYMLGRVQRPLELWGAAVLLPLGGEMGMGMKAGSITRLGLSAGTTADVAGTASGVIKGTGKVVIGETMARVRGAAREIGAETFETTATTAKEMYRDNMRWLRTAMRNGSEVVDIGIDPFRIGGRSPWYRLEQELLQVRGYSVTKYPYP